MASAATHDGQDCTTDRIARRTGLHDGQDCTTDRIARRETDVLGDRFLYDPEKQPLQLEKGPVEREIKWRQGDSEEMPFQWNEGGVIALFFNRHPTETPPARGE